jgi:hypothetical protein
MATPADQRLLELLNTWLKSLELHARYSSLDDDSYWKIQPWVEHQRPSRWIVELAMQKTIALRGHIEERIKMGDTTYSDSLELMIFLANLVGSEHIERFIPAVEPQNERPLKPAAAPPAEPEEAASAVSDTVEQPAPESAAATATATREMPKFLATKRAPPPTGSNHVARTERKTAPPARPVPKPAAKPPARPAPKPAGKHATKGASTAQPDRGGPSDAAREQVVADAARLVQWGRKWYELPELIARMAGRPTLPEVRRILKENKAAIDAKAGVA